ncbi:MAG: hypothetical protein K5695_06375 [Oscillospiraceae bacterium]|nr:hypothetical protein [Oscillospiraceae bacterium]
MDLEKYFSAASITGKVQKAIAADTAKALLSFCGQEPEFAQAIEQSGKSFQACLDHVAKGVGTSLSDFQAYSKAVEFYFPGANVIFQMRIDLVGNADKPEEHVKPLTVSFDSLLDF